MSIGTWATEFVPVSAAKAAKNGMVAAAEHSLRRWIGFRKENRAKHALGKGYACGQDCALCILAPKEVFDPESEPDCSRCPLCIVRDGIPCDDGPGISPYHDYLCDDDPEPMISWLEKAVAYAKEHEENKGNE